MPDGNAQVIDPICAPSLRWIERENRSVGDMSGIETRHRAGICGTDECTRTQCAVRCNGEIASAIVRFVLAIQRLVVIRPNADIYAGAGSVAAPEAYPQSRTPPPAS